MKIYFNTYPSAFQCAGGGEIQLLKSKQALEGLGHKVYLFDQWTHNLSDADVIHNYSVQGGIYNLFSYASNNLIPLVLSPILWLSECVDEYPMQEINYMLGLADVICPNSYAEVERFLKHFDVPRNKYHVTHNGVDACFFDPIDPGLFRAKFDMHDSFVLCVANIEVRKNQIALLEACHRLEVQVVLAGNVRDEKYMDEINEKYSGKFKYIGYLDHDSPILRSAYAACSAFVLPSLLETPGIAALEASAIGVPLVITQEGCTKEYFGEDAYYVNPNSIEDIIEKINLAINNNSCRGLNKSRINQFTWDHVGKELEFAYLQAIRSVSNKKSTNSRNN